MPAAIVRNVFPVVTAVAATLYLVAAVPGGGAADGLVSWAPAQADEQPCRRGGPGGTCLGEADGQAHFERAGAAAREVAARRAGR